MAEIKITSLAAISDPASTDVLPIVDVSADITNKISIADLLKNATTGSASSPSFAFDGDSNTGMYRSGADALAFSTNGTGRLFIDSSGNVGIGTTSNLLASGTRTTLSLSNTGSAAVVLGVDGTREAHFYADDTQVEISAKNKYLFFTAGGAERVRIDASGRVGIGTSSPTQKLSVNGNLQFEADDGVTIGAKESLNVNLNSSGGQSNRVFQIKDNGTARVTFQQAGNVGIGTSSPQGLFESKTANVQPGDAAYSKKAVVSNIPFSTSDVTASALAIYDGSIHAADIGYSYDTSGYYLAFATNDNTAGSPIERMRIDSSGNVGINKTPATYQLEVSGGTANTVASFESTDATSRIRFADSTGEAFVGGEGNAITFYNGSSATERMRIDSSGNVGVGISAPTTKLHIEDSYFRVGTSTNTTTTNTLIEGYGYRLNTSFYGLASIKSSYVNTTNVAGLEFYTTDSSTYAERMRIDSSGNVGIGTSSPDSPGSYAKTLEVSDANSASIVLSRTNTNPHSLELGAYSGVSLIESTGNTSLRFKTNSSERMRILADGGLTFNGDTGQSNALDDYEEGTWTPSIDSSAGSATFSETVQSATYTRIGRMVNLQAHITGIGWTGSPSGYMRITGAPYAKMANQFPSAPVRVSNLTFGTDAYNTVEFISASATSVLYLRTSINDSSGQDFPISGVDNGSGIVVFSISYYVA